MSIVQNFVKAAPEIFLFLAIAIGTVLGRIRFRGFTIGATACTLIVAVALGQIGEFVIPSLLKSIFFGFFVFTIGYRSGPEFFASLSIRTLSQVVLALVIGITGLAVVLTFAFILKFDPGTAAGVAAGSLTQSSMMGTASGALAQLGLPNEALQQQQANIAAGYSVTYILGYILVLLFVPLVAPRLMGINLKQEAMKLEAALSGGAEPKEKNLIYRKFQARAYEVSAGAGKSVAELESQIGRRAVIERILRSGKDIETKPDARLQAGDEILLAGPTGAIVAAHSVVGAEIEGEHVMRSVPGEVLEVLVTSRDLHGRTLTEIVERVGDSARGVFLRALTRHGQDVPLTPRTRIYVGDVMTLIGLSHDLGRVAAKVGQVMRAGDRIDVAFVAFGLAGGLSIGLLSFTLGPVPLTLGGGGGALIAGLICGWLHSRRPTVGTIPPAAQQTLADIGLGGFVAAIGLVSGHAAWIAIQAHGLMLLMVGIVVTLTPMVVGTIFAHRVLRMNPVIICGALAGAMTVDAAVAGSCEVAESQTPVLGVAVPYAIANIVLTVLGPVIVGVTSIG
ncbi:MAG TPA: transporter [Pseudolabrys sp.]|nr:transporter [Pseudolabrys sp.]